jgi:hypothetical protein
MNYEKSCTILDISYEYVWLRPGTPKINDGLDKEERFNEIFGIAYSNTR